MIEPMSAEPTPPGPEGRSHKTPALPEPKPSSAVVRTVPIKHAYTGWKSRLGVQVDVVTANGDRVWTKDVWQKTSWGVPMPLYARRLVRAQRRAERIARSLG
jgi:hypothetical protein